ncbi:MAG TPA: response regulator [Candidatus Omnitrophota bacterium]|nr:response regulator [Candidatus Omnitrophota bacterium]HPS37210.1 response regulator [Candidatus Omnitrophota bacterium]
MPAKKILIVDDEPDILEMLRQRLKAAGYEVCSAVDGEEAVLKARNERPNLIIMDVLMPKLTGYEALRRIRDDNELRRIPAIIISAKGSMRDFFADLPVEFISKPYDPKLLLSKIEELTGGSVARRSAGPRRAVLLGNEDFLIKKMQQELESSGFHVSVALNEEDAYKIAKSFHCDLILCQLWEDEKVLDPRKLYAKVAGDVTLAQVAFCVFCKEGLSLDAMKSFQGKQLLTYAESGDLVKKLNALVNEVFPS